jgi:hypothetical protein
MGAYGCTEPMAGGGWWEAAAAAAAEERHGAGGRRGAAGASGGGGCEKDVCYYSREPPPPPRPVPCVRLGGGGQGLRDTARDTHGNDVRGLRSHGSPSREHTSTLRSACRAVLPHPPPIDNRIRIRRTRTQIVACASGHHMQPRARTYGAVAYIVGERESRAEHSHLKPAAGRGSQVEDTVAFGKKVELSVELDELERRARAEALLLSEVVELVEPMAPLRLLHHGAAARRRASSTCTSGCVWVPA